MRSKFVMDSEAKAIVTHISERSVLGRLGDSFIPHMIGGRSRFATCSGVAWLPGHHLAVVNLYGQTLRIYRLEHWDHGYGLTLLHESSEGLSYPEVIAATPKGDLLAVSHSMSAIHGISLHDVDVRSQAPGMVGKMLRSGSSFHGLCFSPDSRHLAYTDIGAPGFVEVAHVESGACTSRIDNPYFPLKPKAVALSSDSRFAVVAYAPNALNLAHATSAQKEKGTDSGSLLAVYGFDPANGVIEPEPLATIFGMTNQLGVVDGCTIMPSVPGRPLRILAADQANDFVSAHDFDPQTLTLSCAGIFATGLSFPHDVAPSQDGSFIAVANYGNDSVSIFEVSEFQASSSKYVEPR
jgi:hypothetical protein